MQAIAHYLFVCYIKPYLFMDMFICFLSMDIRLTFIRLLDKHVRNIRKVLLHPMLILPMNILK